MDLQEAQRRVDGARHTLASAEAEVVRRLEWLRQCQAEVEQLKRKAAEAVPVDRHMQELVSGKPVPEDRSHTQLKPNGQQQDYVVLSAEERAKGFVRPVRRTYVHEKCGVATTMGQSLAETYARDPKFYSGTFCCGCGTHFPVGEKGEFVWDDGSKVGT